MFRFVNVDPHPIRFADRTSPVAGGGNVHANFHRLKPSVERGNVERRKSVMAQPAQIGFEHGAQIADAVFQHGKAIEPAAEGEALIARRIDAAHFQHARMHHAGAREFQPVIAGAEFDLSA